MTHVTHSRSVLFLLMVAALVGAMMLSVSNTRADEVPTEAQVNAGGAVAPNIECKWELPDMDSTTPGIQYNNDDQPNVVPDANPGVAGNQPPCAGPPTTPATQPDGVTNVIQVGPNPENLPENRRIQLWAAVDHQNGVSNISDVYWKIFHPDGTFKIQVHGVAVPTAQCEAYGNGTSAANTMFGSAVATGQMTVAAANDINVGIITKCKQNEKRLYFAEFDISKHQPCGSYLVEVHAVSNGAEDVMTNYLNVLCVFYGRLDFSNVNFGTITPGLTKVVSGDFLFNPPTSVQPTIKNIGNSGMGISVRFHKMVQQNTAGPKEIDQFDVCFARLRVRPDEDGNYTLRCLDPVFAGNTVSLDGPTLPQDTVLPIPAQHNQVLCPNEVGKLDLSIHPPSTLPSGVYKGKVDILFHSSPICPTDNGSVHPGTGGV